MAWKGSMLCLVKFKGYNGYKVYGLQVHVLRVRDDNL